MVMMVMVLTYIHGISVTLKEVPLSIGILSANVISDPKPISLLLLKHSSLICKIPLPSSGQIRYCPQGCHLISSECWFPKLWTLWVARGYRNECNPYALKKSLLSFSRQQIGLVSVVLCDWYFICAQMERPFFSSGLTFGPSWDEFLWVVYSQILWGIEFIFSLITHKSTSVLCWIHRNF